MDISSKCGPRLFGFIAVLAAALTLSSCSAFKDFSGDTCDGRAPVNSLETAGKDFVAAVYANDRYGVCRVTAPLVNGTLNDSMLQETRTILESSGITEQNVVVEVGEQMGSHYIVHLSDGSGDQTHRVQVDGRGVRDSGYTIGFPASVYPPETEMNNDPAAPASTASVDR